jgi:hypothetical protein
MTKTINLTELSLDITERNRRRKFYKAAAAFAAFMAYIFMLATCNARIEATQTESEAALGRMEATAAEITATLDARMEATR